MAATAGKKTGSVNDAIQAAQCAFPKKSPQPQGNCTPALPKKASVKTGLGANVDKTVSKSPKFVKKVKKLQAEGWKFKYGKPGGGSFCDKQKKEIVVDGNEKGDTKAVVTTLAHEVGHAGYKGKYTPPAGLTKQQYVNANVRDQLDDEGEATLTNIELKRDLKSHCGPDVAVAGAHAKDYEKIYDKYPAAKDRKKARKEIGDIFADKEHPSTDPGKTYRQYYAKPYEDYYDKNVAGKTP